MIKDKVFFTQTDTTLGFISQNRKKLDAIKKRPADKKYILAIDSLATLKHFVRVPKRFKNQVRRAHKTTFIFPNGNSYRVIKDKEHLKLISRLKWAYTSSANLSNHSYDESYAREVADITIEPLDKPAKASTIYKIGLKKIKKVR